MGDKSEELYRKTEEISTVLATVPLCLEQSREMKREHKRCCLHGKAVAITYWKVNKQPKVPLKVVFLSHYFSNDAGD